MEKGVATLVGGTGSDIEHVIVCLTKAGRSTRLLPPGTRVIELGKPPGNSFRFIRMLSRTLGDLRPDIVHTRNWGGVDGVIAARLAGIRAVVHGEHGLVGDDPSGLNRKRLFIRKLVDRWVREYVCVTHSLLRWLTDEVKVRRPVTQIHNGVDTDLYSPGNGEVVRNELNLPETAFVVGVVARLDPIKDHPTLLKAFEDLRAVVPDAALVVIGDGVERSRLEAMAGAGVRFLGDRPDVPELLNAMDLFVLPSRNEGMSNTILEAMATGVPVAASRVGGNTELIEDGVTGSLFPAGDAVALSALMRRHFEMPDLCTALGTAGRQRVQACSSVEAMVNGYRAVWDRVASAARAESASKSGR